MPSGSGPRGWNVLATHDVVEDPNVIDVADVPEDDDTLQAVADLQLAGELTDEEADVLREAGLLDPALGNE